MAESTIRDKESREDSRESSESSESVESYESVFSFKLNFFCYNTTFISVNPCVNKLLMSLTIFLILFPHVKNIIILMACINNDIVIK